MDISINLRQIWWNS